MLAGRPDTVRGEHAGSFASAAAGMEREFRQLRLDEPAGFGWMTQDLNPAGAVGDASAATAAKGEAALDHGARAFVELLREVDRFDLARLAADRASPAAWLRSQAGPPFRCSGRPADR